MRDCRADRLQGAQRAGFGAPERVLGDTRGRFRALTLRKIGSHLGLFPAYLLAAGLFVCATAPGIPASHLSGGGLRPSLLSITREAQPVSRPRYCYGCHCARKGQVFVHRLFDRKDRVRDLAGNGCDPGYPDYSGGWARITPCDDDGKIQPFDVETAAADADPAGGTVRLSAAPRPGWLLRRSGHMPRDGPGHRAGTGTASSGRSGDGNPQARSLSDARFTPGDASLMGGSFPTRPARGRMALRPAREVPRGPAGRRPEGRATAVAAPLRPGTGSGRG